MEAVTVYGHHTECRVTFKCTQMKIIYKTNTIYSPTFTLFAFHTNKKQYLDTLHAQIKKEKKCTFGCSIMTLL